MVTLAQYLYAKQLLPSELRTKEWQGNSRLAAWVSERAFFMASVTRHADLQAYRDAAAMMAEGRLSLQEARQRVRDALAASGYQAPAGLEGTIKDLSAVQRMNATLKTNVAMAAGWRDYTRRLGDADYPGQELYRGASAIKPRDWDERWKTAAASVGYKGVARDGSWIALIDSPVWIALSTFGNPYPPYDWGSHMRVRPVDFDVCVRLGLLTEDDYGYERPIPSLNESVVVRPSISDPAVRRSLTDSLQGLAEWDGDMLRMTDPNGTRAYDWNKIGDVITSPLPAGMRNYQLEALGDWVHDSSLFRRSNPAAPKNIGLDEKEDMIRLVNRINPVSSEEGGRVSRALSMSDENKFKALVDAIESSGEYGLRPGTIAESWTKSEQTVQEFARKNYSIVLECDDYVSRKRIDGLYDIINSNKQKEGKPMSQEGESLFPGNVRFEVIGKPRMTKTKDGKVTYVYQVREKR